MALVAYDCSDDSDDQESEEVVETKIIPKEATVKTDPSTSNHSGLKEVKSNVSASKSFMLPNYRTDAENKITDEDDDDDDDDDDSDDDKLVDISFSSLPKPQYETLYIDDSKIKSSKSGLWKKLISLPRVSQPLCKISSKIQKLYFEEYYKNWDPNYEEQQRVSPLVTKKNSAGKRQSRTKQSKMESGLLSLLPSPTNESVKTTEKGVIIKTKLLPTAVKNKMKTEKQKVQKTDNDDDENSDSETDFFSLSKVDKVEDYDTSAVDLDIDIENSLKNVEVPKNPAVIANDKQISGLAKFLREDDHAEDSKTVCKNAVNSDMDSQNHLNLDEDAVLALCGRKRKGQSLDDVQVIDIHEDSILAETRKNLTKRLTEEVSYRPARPGGPSSLSKRKHQITYLAYQAKERELELKNQWANNRFTKRQTQSKYGF